MDEFPEDVEATSIGPLSGGPLAGVTVLEVSSVVMAPLAGRILAKLGAVITRVEPPGGDVIRRSGAARHPNMAGTHLSLGDGKRNIAIDLGSAEGQAELRQLIAGCDLIVTNHLPRRRHQFGLDWKSIELVNPRAILCTAQGYASSSDLADEPAYDDTVQAASGTCDIFAKSGDGPRYAPYLMADKVAGLTLVYSALAALHYRDRTGQGQWVDVPMIDALADFNLVEQLNEFTFDPPLGEPGWHRTLAPTRVPHPSMDGWICILPYSDRNWADFLRLTGVARGEQPVPLPTNQERNANAETVQGIIADYAATRSTEQILEECHRRGIPAQPVNTIESLLEDPYLRSRRTIERIDHPTEGPIWRTSPNMVFSASPLPTTRPAGQIDQDRVEIFSDASDH